LTALSNGKSLNAALWDSAFAAIDARSAMKPESNATNASLWSQAFDKADAARLATSPGATTGTTPATDAGGSEDPASLWDRAYDSVRR
jgi:hypothetical protein